MRTRSKLLLTALAAAFVLAAAVGSASAGRFMSSEQRFRVTWARLEASGFATNISCSVTIEGSYHGRTSSKTAELLAGYVTGVTVRHPCTGGEAWSYNGVEVLEGTTVPNTLPWHIRYESFQGALPNITAITERLVGARWLAKAVFLGITIRCLYTSTAIEPLIGTVSRNTSTRALTTTEAGGTIRSETGGCPSVSKHGAGVITTPLGASISVTLI